MGIKRKDFHLEFWPRRGTYHLTVSAFALLQLSSGKARWTEQGSEGSWTGALNPVPLLMGCATLGVLLNIS